MVACALFALPTKTLAHCDTLTGPVVSAARVALQTRDVTPVLKWVKENSEAEVRRTFEQTLTVRTLNAAARELADRFFFETVVRLHRAGEGEPYTGLKDGTEVDEAIVGVDNALASGQIGPLVALVTDRTASGIRERFAEVRRLQSRAGDSVAAGRRYVEAYVALLRYVESVAATGPAAADAHKTTEPPR
jgi:hypothetical protein